MQIIIKNAYENDLLYTVYITSRGITGDRIVYFFLLEIVSEIVQVQPSNLMHCWLAALNIVVSYTIKML